MEPMIPYTMIRMIRDLIGQYKTQKALIKEINRKKYAAHLQNNDPRYILGYRIILQSLSKLNDECLKAKTILNNERRKKT